MATATKKITRAQSDKIFAFETEHGKTKKATLTPIPGLTVNLEYVYSFSPRYSEVDVEVEDYSVKATKAFKPVTDALGGYDFAELIYDHIEGCDLVPEKELTKLTSDFRKALAAIPEGFRNKLSDLQNYEDSAAFWKAVDDAQNYVEPPAPVRFRINSGYSADIVAGKENIQVGCQSIPVSQVRALLAKIDEVNQTPAKK